MNSARRLLSWLFILSLWCSWMTAQQTSLSAEPGVPRLVNFCGKAIDAQGKTIVGIAGVTFAIYADQFGAAPLWMETQNVQADTKGNYTVQLGATKSEGLPLDLFTSSQARWLAVTINGGEEQPRILLLSVPYALKAADAETIGGLPPSAFVLATPQNATAATYITEPAAGQSVSPGAATDVTTTGSTGTFLPVFNGASTIIDSVMVQVGTGSTAKIGINTTTPTSTLGVNGAATIGGLTLPAAGTATATAGTISHPLNLVASAFSSSSGAAVNQTFRWQTEPAGNDTATPSGTLNLLFGSGTSTPAETGLKIASNGYITFATGQMFPGTGKGTITGVTAGTDLTGGGTKGTVTLNLDTTKVPLLAATNTFSGNNTFNVSADADAVDAYTAGPGKTAVVGVQSATSGGSYGVYGLTFDSAGAGVAGINRSSSAQGIGVYGQYDITTSGTNGIGVFGQNGSESTSGRNVAVLAQEGIGTWGDGGTTGGIGVLGTVDDGNAAFLENNSSTNETLGVFNSSSGSLLFAEGLGGGSCTIDTSGNLSCSGTKSAIVPVDGGKRAIALSAIESPQNWFEDFGEAELENGAAVVQLDSTYTQTVNTDTKYQVFLTPYGDCKGLYVTNRTANSFEVHELGGGTASLSFGYRIAVLRKNYENVRFDDRTRQMEHAKQMRERMQSGAGHPVSHDPGKKLALPWADAPAKSKTALNTGFSGPLAP
jgi:hypothetical protein